MVGMNVQHSKAKGAWYTPPEIVEAARAMLGGVIDLDPASCHRANAIVKARRFGSIELQAPAAEWSAAETIFLNPPTPPKFWWQALDAWHRERAGRRAVYIAYSLEQVQQSHGWTDGGMLRHAVIIPAKRIAYFEDKEASASRLPDCDLRRRILAGPDLVRGPSPPHAGAIVLLGDLDPRPMLEVVGGSVMHRVKL